MRVLRPDQVSDEGRELQHDGADVRGAGGRQEGALLRPLAERVGDGGGGEARVLVGRQGLLQPGHVCGGRPLAQDVLLLLRGRLLQQEAALQATDDVSHATTCGAVLR